MKLGDYVSLGRRNPFCVCGLYIDDDYSSNGSVIMIMIIVDYVTVVLIRIIPAKVMSLVSYGDLKIFLFFLENKL